MRRLVAHVELENSGDHDHGLRAVAILEHRKFQGFGAVDEQTTAKAFLILNDPVAAVVLPIRKSEEFEQLGEGGLSMTLLLWLELGKSLGLGCGMPQRAEDRHRSSMRGDAGARADHLTHVANVPIGAYEFEMEARPFS